MSWISKKDIALLLDAGFSEEDLGLVEGGMQGVEVYETPDDYFARELIENACEQGECSLMEEDIGPDPAYLKERPDTSRKGLYDDQEYDGNDDWMEDVPVNCRAQAQMLKTVKLGKITVWQRRNDKGIFEWPVKNLKVTIPEEEMPRYNRLSPEGKKELWMAYARDEWRRLWECVAYSLRYSLVDSMIEFKTKKGLSLNIFVIPADNVRDAGYENLPAEARWVTMVYFNKDRNK